MLQFNKFYLLRTTALYLASSVPVLLAVQSPSADELQNTAVVYINSSVASVRVEPLDDAPIAAKIPIGTLATYEGSPARVAEFPNNNCEGAYPLGDPKWSCICITGLRVTARQRYLCGWVAREILTTKEPKLTDLIATYDKTPASKLSERRKLAERAVALDPLNTQARERLVDTLEKLKDAKALEATKRSFFSYTTGLPSDTGAKIVFLFYDNYIEPIAELKKGRIVIRNFDGSTNYEFRNRGHFYNLYADGKNIGTVVTEAQFDCHILTCPNETIVRRVLRETTSGAVRGLATNFALANTVKSTFKVSKNQETALNQMGIDLVKSSKISLSPKEKKTFLASIFQGDSSPVWAVGSLDRTGRVILISNWTINSLDGYFYSNEIYESILIIAEQQHDGTFRLASGSGSIAENGCSYVDHLDVDEDGIDEIFLSCHEVEGAYGFGLAQRVQGKWKVTRSEFR